MMEYTVAKKRDKHTPHFAKIIARVSPIVNSIFIIFGAKDHLIMESQNSVRNKPLKMHLLELTSMMVKLKRARMPVPNDAYNNTLDTQLMSAIKRCEKDETALLSVDYPLAESSMIHGMMGLKAYMVNLTYECRFCAEFEGDDVVWLYDRYVAGCEEGNAKVLNIYSAVYLNALFCDYLKKDYGTLRLTAGDCKIAQNLLAPLVEDDRREILYGCAKHFTFGSIAYNNKTFDRIFPAVNTAIKRKTLADLLVIE